MKASACLGWGRGRAGASGLPSTRRGRPALRALVLALSLELAVGGCTSMKSVAPDEIEREGLRNARVVMNDGYTYRFDRIRIEEDAVVGTYRVVQERVDGDGVAFVEVERESRLPMDQVRDIRISERDLGKSLLLGAGAAIFGVWLKGVLVDEEEPAPTYSGKPPQ